MDSRPQMMTIPPTMPPAPVDCSLVELETDVDVIFTGNPGNITEVETDQLETEFPLTYNELVSEVFCGEPLRTVVSATILSISEEENGVRRLEGSQEKQNPRQLVGRFRARFRVRGRCRGCRNNPRFFDDAVRRALIDSSGRRSLIEELPTELEFTAEYDETVVGLDLDNVNGVEETAEIIVAQMIIDLTGLPESVDVRLFDSANGGSVRFLPDSGGVVLSTPVLATVYDVILTDNSWAVLTVPSVDCSTGSCSPGLVSAVLEVDLSGLPEQNTFRVSLRNFASNALREFRGVSSAGGSVLTLGVLALSNYTISIAEGGGAGLVFDGVNCSTGSCSVTGRSNEMSIDMTVLPESVDVRLFDSANGGSVRFLPDSGGVVLSTPVLATVYDVILTDNSWAVLTVPSVDCSTGSCSPGLVSAVLEVDLSGLPEQNTFRVSLRNFASNALREFRGVSSAGGSVLTLGVLALSNYTISITEGGGAGLVFDGVNCSTGSCSVTGRSNEMSIDMTVLPQSVDVGLFDSANGGSVRGLRDSGGVVLSTPVLATVYDVILTDNIWAVLTVPTVDCSTGSCSPGLVSAVLEVDLSGLPEQNTFRVSLRNFASNALREFRGVSSAGGSVLTLGVLALSNYTISITEGGGAGLVFDGVNCSTGSCSVTGRSNEMSIDMTVLPQSVDVGLFDSANGGSVRGLRDSGGVVLSTPVLATVYDVILTDNIWAVLTVPTVDCSTGSCSPGLVSAVLEVDLSGLPEQNTFRVSLRNFASNALREFRGVSSAGGSVLTLGVLALSNYTISITEGGGAGLVFDGVNCSTGSCSVTGRSNEMSIDMTVLPESVDVRLFDSANGGSVRFLPDSGGVVLSTPVLATVYDVILTDNSWAVLTVPSVDCSTGSCSPGLVSAVLEVDLSGLPEQNTFRVSLRNFASNALREFRGVSSAGGSVLTLGVLALSNYTISITEGGGAGLVFDGVNCSTGSCSVTGRSNEMSIDMTVLPESVDVRLFDSANGGSVRFLPDSGGVVLSTPVLATVYDVILTDNSWAVLTVPSVDCSTGSCSPGLVSAVLEVDLSGLPEQNTFRVSLRNFASNALREFRGVSSAGGSVLTLGVLALSNYTISITEGGGAGLVFDGVNCSTGSCSVGGMN